MLVEARGRVVSAGVDVALFRDIAEGPQPARQGADLWTQLLRVQTIEDLPVPTVFAAHGLTTTAAFELALACDVLLAAERALFGLVEIVVGLTPSMGGPQRPAERVTAGVRQGARAADDLVPEVSGALFGTDDLRGAVRSFLTEGPGKARHSGR